MLFEQEKNTNFITISFGEPNKLVYPEVGKIYNAFDDGKVRRSRLMKVKITKAIDLDKDKVSKSLLKLLAHEIKACHWLYNKEQTIIYRAKALNDDNTYDKELGYCYFLKTQDNEWFGVGMGWFDSLLDVDGRLWKEVLKYETELNYDK